jgi:ankyrin repeat protein
MLQSISECFTHVNPGIRSGCAELEKVKYLVESKADIEFQDKHGYTYLTSAIDCNFPKTVKYLIEKKADINLKDKKLLQPLHLAVYHNNPEIIKCLVENKADVNLQKCKCTGTALILASQYSSLKIVKYLVANKADVNLRDNYTGFSGCCTFFGRKNPFFAECRGGYKN